MVIFLVISLMVSPGILLSNGSGVKDEYAFAKNTVTFTTNQSLNSSASSIFIGESDNDYAGRSVVCAGDINGDGIDDILIGATSNDQSLNNAGKTYLIFGDRSSRKSEISLSEADASFVGIGAGDWSGSSIAGAGDVNNDGYDDFLIGASQAELYPNEPLVGITYLILGRPTGWTHNTSLWNANASFVGENIDDYSGEDMDIGGDVNGDGFDDILIGTPKNDEGGQDVGQAYLILGRSRWSMNMSLSDSDASFIDHTANAEDTGRTVAFLRDVNGDGYDDFAIGSARNEGQIYIIFGKQTGWSMDTSLDNADAKYIGEYNGDDAGRSIIGGYDINNDGYNDTLIGARDNDDNGDRSGKFYILLGRSSGWRFNAKLFVADASFIGESESDLLGTDLSMGDLDNDGLIDIMASAPYKDVNGEDRGKTYLILGETLELTRNQSISNAEVSFIGENSRDFSGMRLSLEGDYNGDGWNDILIGVYHDEQNGEKGKVYLIDDLAYTKPSEVVNIEIFADMGYTETCEIVDFGEMIYVSLYGTDSDPSHVDHAKLDITIGGDLGPFRIFCMETDFNSGRYQGKYLIPHGPQYFEIVRCSSRKDPSKYDEVSIEKPNRPDSVTSIKTYYPDDLSEEINNIELGEVFQIRLEGVDSDPTSMNWAFINFTSERTQIIPIVIMLNETGTNTGIYTGTFSIPNNIFELENLTFYSVRDKNVVKKMKLGRYLQIGPRTQEINAYEDEYFSIEFNNEGLEDIYSWSFESDSVWLEFNTLNGSLYGTPRNDDVGIDPVTISLSDYFGHTDEVEYQIVVANEDPTITTEIITEATEDVPYYLDLNCTDDGMGIIRYYVDTDHTWLSIDTITGVLNGTPRNDDVGTEQVTVSVTDDNGGIDSRTFELTVRNVNDPPIIIPEDVKTIEQDENFVRNYYAEDVDVDDELIWKLITNASFLSLDPETGTLSGTPNYNDVGKFFVNISVWDISNAFDHHNFTLTVENVNDPPFFIDFPYDAQLVQGDIFSFDINASDHDNDDLVYSISSQPESDISIDENTGLIFWEVNISKFDKESYNYECEVTISDGERSYSDAFTIEVFPSIPPVSTLVDPVDKERTSSEQTILEWTGTDSDGEPISYFIYLHKTESFVEGRRTEALIQSNYIGNNITLRDLEHGTTYFWTVLPFAGGSIGTSSNGIYSFKVNNKPEIKPIKDHVITSGSEFKIMIECIDKDPEDINSLRFYLVESPEGMTIDEETGLLKWTPSDDQLILHEITVGVTDGVDNYEETFKIEVQEGGSSSSSSILSPIIIGIAVILIVVIGMVIFLAIRSKKGREEEAIRDEEDEESKGTTTYEELYGVPAPDMEEEGMTTRELKDYIHDQIEHLEE